MRFDGRANIERIMRFFYSLAVIGRVLVCDGVYVVVGQRQVFFPLGDLGIVDHSNQAKLNARHQLLFSCLQVIICPLDLCSGAG